jgi:hypothetical protein
VTLAFLDGNGKNIGEVKLRFNVPASHDSEWHETDIPGGKDLFDQSSTIVASAADNNAARPTEGTWEVKIVVSGNPP